MASGLVQPMQNPSRWDSGFGVFIHPVPTVVSSEFDFSLAEFTDPFKEAVSVQLSPSSPVSCSCPHHFRSRASNQAIASTGVLLVSLYLVFTFENNFSMKFSSIYPDSNVLSVSYLTPDIQKL